MISQASKKDAWNKHLWNLENMLQVPLQLLIHLICHAFILIRAWQLLRQKLDQINYLSRVSTSICRHVTAAWSLEAELRGCYGSDKHVTYAAVTVQTNMWQGNLPWMELNVLPVLWISSQQDICTALDQNCFKIFDLVPRSYRVGTAGSHGDLQRHIFDFVFTQRHQFKPKTI